MTQAYSGFGRGVVLDDAVDGRDVKASGGYVGAQQGGLRGFAEAEECLRATRLFHLALGGSEEVCHTATQ